jgi:hypothetical protein
MYEAEKLKRQTDYLDSLRQDITGAVACLINWQATDYSVKNRTALTCHCADSDLISDFGCASDSLVEPEYNIPRPLSSRPGKDLPGLSTMCPRFAGSFQQTSYLAARGLRTILNTVTSDNFSTPGADIAILRKRFPDAMSSHLPYQKAATAQYSSVQ